MWYDNFENKRCYFLLNLTTKVLVMNVNKNSWMLIFCKWTFMQFDNLLCVSSWAKLATTTKSLFLCLSSAFCNFNLPGKCCVRWVNWRDVHLIKVSTARAEQAAAKESGRTRLLRCRYTHTNVVFAQQQQQRQIKPIDKEKMMFVDVSLKISSVIRAVSPAVERESTKNQRGVRRESSFALINMTRHCFYCRRRRVYWALPCAVSPYIYINQSFFLLCAHEVNYTQAKNENSPFHFTKYGIILSLTTVCFQRNICGRKANDGQWENL